MGNIWASLVAQTVKNLLAVWETWVQSLGQEDSLVRFCLWGVHETIVRGGRHLRLPLRFGLRPQGPSRIPLSDFTFTFHFHALEREMATHSSVLAWRIPGTEEPGGLQSMGLLRVGHH